ncbi:MAG: MurT ligase domain-containing protein [Eubacteriales bacterium]|nr:MurT ligase domain-containing protein [Eubacteriales bacterium]
MAGKLGTILAVGSCKAARKVLHLLKRGGTTTPGKAAMFFDRNILAKTAEGVETIVVVGTNGKTTTAHMLERAMTAAGMDPLANRSGANLLPGITAEFTAEASISGHARRKYAVIECDEAALKLVVPLVNPKVIAVTNLFRDQLDRYGEVMNTLEQIRIGVRMVPEAILCLNADDSLVASLALDVPNPVVYFGLDLPVGEQKDAELSDARYCIRCGTEYTYSYHTYAHLGGFRCPNCGYRRHQTDVAVTAIRSMGMDGSDIELRFGTASEGKKQKQTLPEAKPHPDTEGSIKNTERKPEITGGSVIEHVHVGLPAVYNIYNAACAAAAFTAAGYDRQKILPVLAEVHSSFGRMETFDLDGVRVQMILVKNPAGCSQALDYLAAMEEPYQAVFCLNDRTADGHDISWIWDADFEKVCRDPHMLHAYVLGDRAEDMQLRLKYADMEENGVEKVNAEEELIEKMRKSEVPVFILPNYTAMLSLRAVLGRITGKDAFWKG